jgi:hypothetical protein
MATCFDDRRLVFDSAICVLSVSKDVKGELLPPKQRAHECAEQHCKTLLVRDLATASDFLLLDPRPGAPTRFERSRALVPRC